MLQAAEAEVKAAQEHAALFQATVLAGPDVGPAFHHLLEIVAGLYPDQVGVMKVPSQRWLAACLAGGAACQVHTATQTTMALLCCRYLPAVCGALEGPLGTCRVGCMGDAPSGDKQPPCQSSKLYVPVLCCPACRCCGIWCLTVALAVTPWHQPRRRQARPRVRMSGSGGTWPASARRLVVLGPALSGKTAQCARLSAHFDCPHVSAGELLHAEVQARSELGLQAEALLDKSKTVPDALVLQLVVRRLQQADCLEQGWVLDGFPHTQAQVGPETTNLLLDRANASVMPELLCYSGSLLLPVLRFSAASESAS